ncbi:hypothetical protein PHAVU_005G133600 [Phaseolus vulgaris]|uniref:Uncharacterized protein n=1 Tax=Phaseolus vulgaris TaxID=3885 RepID=V7BYP6_PHAVU|nr:hypothetical protein PHAVU_005G133600g [Phaseolus vulgaris]ESW22178.1 hypothetical protein PHAVU_005G133600g [Phaseolus vulgaris]
MTCDNAEISYVVTAPFTTPTILCDNLNIVTLSHNPILHAKAKKHVELANFLFTEALNKTIIVQHIPAPNQNADFLTKLLTPL